MDHGGGKRRADNGNTFRSDLELQFAMDSVQALPDGDLRSVG